LGIRARAELKTRLDGAAKWNDRSLSQEAEIRLEQSFHEEDWAKLFHDRVYGRQAAGLLELLGMAIRNATMGRISANDQMGILADDWMSDPAVFDVFEGQIREILHHLRPADECTWKPQSDALASKLGRGSLLSVLRGKAGHGSDDRGRLGAIVREKIGEAAVNRIAESLGIERAAEGSLTGKDNPR
jgi:hypothetical protein